MDGLRDVADESFCYLTTRGRTTGNPHEIEIWFAARGSSIYMLSGGGEQSDWVQNILVTPEVKVRVAGRVFAGDGRVVDDPTEGGWARKALLDKYNPTYSRDLTGWSQVALPPAVDIRAPGRSNEGPGKASLTGGS